MGRFGGIGNVFKHKPLQAGKFVGILLTIVLGIGGFLRIVNATAIIGDPRLGDGQFLTVVLIPLISLALVLIVFAEALYAGYRSLRSRKSIPEQITGRFGYLLLRAAEAIFAVVGVVIIVTVIPVVLAESTPAPAGVGAMLLLMVVGFGILCTSFIRASVELFVYGSDA